MDTPETIWSVSDVNKAVKEIIEGSLLPFWLVGEVSSLSLQQSGHAYYSLKDADSQIRVCFFGGARLIRELKITNGSLIEVFGHLDVYTRRGEYQFIVQKIRPAGIGEMQKRIEELKKRLEAEGLFAQERKKKLPYCPGRIGVVTSPTGAAIQDFLQILNRRFPNVNVKIFPCLVQGGEAAPTIAKGVKFFNRTNQVDVIVVTRGGGSMEDLYPFNEEVAVRAVADSKIPIISAVGHEIDYTLCDFAADFRAPTPSAAAELVIPRYDDLTQTINKLKKELSQTTDIFVKQQQVKLAEIMRKKIFSEPSRLLELHQQRTDELERSLFSVTKLSLMNVRNRFDKLNTKLEALNPNAPLERGYAMVFKHGTQNLVSTSKQEKDTLLDLCFTDGKITVKTE